MNGRIQPGFSLLEILAVIAILGIIAVVAMPDFSSSDETKLELAAKEVASALRFARSEALRSGEKRGVLVDHETQQVRVYKLPTLPPPPENTLYHPITKQPYDFNVSTSAMISGVVITNTSGPFDFSGLGQRKDVFFDRRGMPLFIEASAIYQLAGGDIRLAYGAAKRSIHLEPVTGRVTIQ